MTKIFYDHLISLDKVEKVIKKVAQSSEEREELWQTVDEIVHHRVLGCIFDNLPEVHHQEFLEKFHAAPHEDSLLDYLKDKIGENIEGLIRQEIGNLTYEILEDIATNKPR